MLEVGTLAATRQTWKRNTVRELVAEVIEEHPKGNERQWRKAFRDAVQNDDEYFTAVCDYAFDAAMVARQRQSERQPPSAQQKAEAAQQRANEAAEHAKLVGSIREQIILLNLEMPNGKRMRNCTGDEMARFGAGYTKIARKVGKTKRVGEVLNEAEVRKLMMG